MIKALEKLILYSNLGVCPGNPLGTWISLGATLAEHRYSRISSLRRMEPPRCVGCRRFGVGNAAGFRLARLFGIGQHLLDVTLHDWKLFLEIDWPDWTDPPGIVRRPRGLQGERHDAKPVGGHAVSVVDPCRGGAEARRSTKFMTAEVEWFGGRVDWASSESPVCRGWSPIGANAGSRIPHRDASRLRLVGT
jgi:hypothetical protein